MNRVFIFYENVTYEICNQLVFDMSHHFGSRTLLCEKYHTLPQSLLRQTNPTNSRKKGKYLVVYEWEDDS